MCVQMSSSSSSKVTPLVLRFEPIQSIPRDFNYNVKQAVRKYWKTHDMGHDMDYRKSVLAMISEHMTDIGLYSIMRDDSDQDSMTKITNKLKSIVYKSPDDMQILHRLVRDNTSVKETINDDDDDDDLVITEEEEPNDVGEVLKCMIEYLNTLLVKPVYVPK